jgi:hypothetical protein
LVILGNLVVGYIRPPVIDMSPAKVFAAFFCLSLALSISVLGKDRVIKNEEYRFKLKVPRTMMKVQEKGPKAEGDVYFDSTANVILMISERQSRFHSVDQYIDCAQPELEQRMRQMYGDPGLMLISCRKPGKYRHKISILHFSVTNSTQDYDTYVIYFIHHMGHEIQFSFTYNGRTEKASLDYIEKIAHSLKLK